MSLASLIDRVAATGREPELIVYTQADAPAVVERFAAANAGVRRRSLPEGTPDGFVVVRDDGAFRGAFPIAELREVLEGPVPDPWDLDDASSDHGALFDLLQDVVFEAFDRRGLLVASREVEELAWRIGVGTLCVGFQSADAFERQRPVYERLLTETDLDVRAYAASTPADVPSGMSFRTEPAETVAGFWFVAFDGGGDETRTCAVVGRQREAETYTGFWTYDPGTVDGVFDAVAPAE